MDLIRGHIARLEERALQAEANLRHVEGERRLLEKEVVRLKGDLAAADLRIRAAERETSYAAAVAKADDRPVIPAARLRHFADLRGHTLAAVAHETGADGHERILFTLADGRQYELHHVQECCETVHVEDIEGDLGSLVGSPLLVAEEVEGETGGEQGFETYRWTFYKLATVRGYVDIRWYGSSNGYYSESVDFHPVTESGR